MRETKMGAFALSRFALSIGVGAALLSACGVLRQAQDDTLIPVAAPGAVKGNKTFKYTGSEQTFTVPKGVTQLSVVARGGEGASLGMYPSTNTPGRPGRVRAIVPVHAGEKLYVFVGGSGLHGGFNGGGAGGASGSGSQLGSPGGGASDVRADGDALTNRIIVAAGGGGAGEAINDYAYAYGGNGGGLAGDAGGSDSKYESGGGGGGGTQSEGGSGGAAGGGSSFGPGKPGGSGALGLGGNGGNGNLNSFYAAGGGGGGGGYYGGGGGGGSSAAYYSSLYTAQQSGGGGGGSSYVEPSAIKSRMWTGWKSRGDGLVVFSWN
jgi:hypothetical protein